MAILITKADGTSQEFNSAKLHGSLVHAGADDAIAEEIVNEIAKELYEGITTTEIYRRAFAHLRERKHPAASRYSLKRAMLEFGPSGFPFEAYLAEIFRAKGYSAKIGQIIQGACVEHEVDVVMMKDAVTTYIEAKFHNTVGFKTDLQVSLYVKARMDDIRATVKDPHAVLGLLATNTKFTSQVVQYSTCAGLGLLGWEYPDKGNLHDLIDETHLYPITALTSISNREKAALMSEKVVLCNGILQNSSAFLRAGIPEKRIGEIITEAGMLCQPGKWI